MQRIFLIYNPSSSRYAEVRHDVIDRMPDYKGYIIGKYEVKPTSIDNNIATFSKLLKDNDIVVSAGGDATGVIAVNSILKSGKDATLGVLPYGNFNDLARTLRTNTLDDILTSEAPKRSSKGSFGGCCRERSGASPVKTGASDRVPEEDLSVLYPLEVFVDGKLWRYATCYVTIGMTAEAVYIYDEPKMRKKLKTNFGRKIISYTELAGWYFKHRHKKQFIPDFTLNGIKQNPKTSDYAAVNGRSMARVMRGGEDYLSPKVFRHETDRLTNFWRLMKLMLRSILHRIPGATTTGDILEFTRPATITLQAEGEHQVFKNIHTIEIKKGSKCLKVIQN